MTCHICTKPISARQRIEYHHPVYRSRGGRETAPSHARCHRRFHSKKGDFREFGRKGAASGAWAFNLKNVRRHSKYDEVRWHYLYNYANIGWSAGLVM